VDVNRIYPDHFPLYHQTKNENQMDSTMYNKFDSYGPMKKLVILLWVFILIIGILIILFTFLADYYPVVADYSFLVGIPIGLFFGRKIRKIDFKKNKS
jgi:hypothetical protein